jgi:hypothetical protein
MFLLVVMRNVHNHNLVYAGKHCMMHLGDAAIRHDIRRNWSEWVYILETFAAEIKDAADRAQNNFRGSGGGGGGIATAAAFLATTIGDALRMTEARMAAYGRQKQLGMFEQFAAKAKFEATARERLLTGEDGEDGEEHSLAWAEGGDLLIAEEEEEAQRQHDEGKRERHREARRRRKLAERALRVEAELALEARLQKNRARSEANGPAQRAEQTRVHQARQQHQDQMQVRLDEAHRERQEAQALRVEGRIARELQQEQFAEARIASARKHEQEAEVLANRTFEEWEELRRTEAQRAAARAAARRAEEQLAAARAAARRAGEELISQARYSRGNPFAPTGR